MPGCGGAAPEPVPPGQVPPSAPDSPLRALRLGRTLGIDVGFAARRGRPFAGRNRTGSAVILALSILAVDG